MAGRRLKVLVAMSGGVDSSVAAALLARGGCEVVGCFMRLGTPGDTFDELLPDGGDAPAAGAPGAAGGAGGETRGRPGHQGCCSVADAADARRVAARLGIPLYVCNFRREFGRIIDYFVGEYDAGRTPNPCVRCNDWLKFGRLHQYAEQIDADRIASGHYARIERRGAGFRLLRSVDSEKDQSYVLFGTERGRLADMLMPLGGYRKAQVREMARELGLPVHDKPDSQEICFVPGGDYAALVGRHSPVGLRPGPIVDRAGRVVGEHAGHQRYTIGQRRGLGVAAGRPLYVIGKDAATNTVTVGSRDDLLSAGCSASQANWHVEPPVSWASCSVQYRAHAGLAEGGVRATGVDALEVRFERAQPAVAPGQAVVCYDGDAVMGGGWITEARRP